MIICCEYDNGYDRFYIPDINTMAEIKTYANNNMPIECHKLKGRYRGSIYTKEEMKFVHLYLNNYLQYYKIDGYISNREMIYEIENNLCFNCINRYAQFDGCKYIKDGLGGCKNYKKEPDGLFKKWLKAINKRGK